MPHLIAPERLARFGGPLVFLAGSIEQGKAEHWQSEVARQLQALRPDVVIADPRRANWDPTLPQDPHVGPLAEQINWELDHLERAAAIIFVFDPNTYSPVTLLELGLMLARAPERTVVVCPSAYWRYANVLITATREGVPVYANRSEGLTALLELIPPPFA